MLSKYFCLNQFNVISRRYLTSSVGPCLAIRRETINAWERRAPFAPVHVKKLTKMGIRVLIQPSNRRAFPIQDYITAGAVVQEDLSEAQLIMSVKQVPIDQLIPDKTYAFFSHTIKAQKENMPMLDTILQRKIRLIDYEKMVDKNNKRLVMFGKWAGYTGFIDMLHGLGLRLLALGHHTPFLHIGLAHNFSDSHMAVNALRDAGYEIALDKMPRSLGPLVFVFTGTGNVSQGAQELFEHLPHEYVDVATLPKVAQRGQRNKVYGCVVGRSDHMVRKEGGVFNAEEFELYPERYVSKFATEIAPYASVIINGIFWGPKNPRLLTIPDAKHLLTPSAKQSLDVPGCPTLPHRLIAVCDISADPGGSIEFMTECTTIDKPFVIYDADKNCVTDNFDSPAGSLICSIDNMPAQMPVEATEQFGSLLLPYILDMLNCSTDQPFDRLNCRDEVSNAIITTDGHLTPNYKYIAELRRQDKDRSAQKSRHKMGDVVKRVLLLGAGYVSEPVVDYFGRQNNISVTIATESQADGERLAAKSDCAVSTVLDVGTDVEALEKLIGQHDIVMSLLPYGLHPLVAKLCIEQKTNMITSSYITPQLQCLDQAAKDAEITIMNEAGLDPGIDHMLAMECIDRVREHGGKVVSFVSFCGGLPAPESSDNPLRYKFSWSPKGVLQALLNPARYLKDGKIVDLEKDGGVLDSQFPISFMPGFNFVGFANRDSTIYADVYGIAGECKTLLRGTLRYQGFAEALKALQKVGLLSLENEQLFNPAHGPDLTWKQLMAVQLNQKMDIFPDSLRHIAAEIIGKDRRVEFDALNTLDLFSDMTVERCGTPLNTLARHLAKELAFKSHERDLVVLNHELKIQLPGGTKERHQIDLVAYGEPNGLSAMARTVGYTNAIVAKMIMDGEIQKKGLVRPLTKECYRPALARLRNFGIQSSTRISQI